MTHEEILNAISEMSVLELSELVKAIEEKFGVSAAAPVAVAAAAPAAGAAAAPCACRARFSGSPPAPPGWWRGTPPASRA